MTPPSQRELLEQFIVAARATTATVETCAASPDAVDACLCAATADDAAVLVAPMEEMDPRLLVQFLARPKVITEPTKRQLATVPTGVTEAFGAVARTGSVCVAATTTTTAPVSMLTRKHIVLVDGTTIVARPRDVLSEEHLGGKGLHRSFSFITGPSATADMGPLVRGVHGPGGLHIIIVE